MNPALTKGQSRRARAFTMLELMIVVAIMGIILVMGLPAIRSALHKEAFVQDLNNILDACDFARSQSILHDTVMEMRIYPQDHRIEVSAVARDTPIDAASSGQPSSPPPSDNPPPPVKTFSATLSDEVKISLLDVDFADYMQADVARIRFYPNGTSSRLTIGIEPFNGTSDIRVISLEEVTALAEVTNLRP